MREGQQRIDQWLWCARILKSRSLAAKLVLAGYVRINGERVTQTSRLVKAGDVLTVALVHTTMVLEVLAPSTRRGPATEARRLYRLQDGEFINGEVLARNDNTG